MNKNVLKSIIILLTLTFVTLQSCKKKTLTDTENGIAKKEIVTADKKAETIENYIFNGKNISKNDIDFNNEHLTLIYGYDKNIYVFYSDDELYKWAVDNDIDKLSQAIVNIKNAREKSEKMSFEKFNQWLSDNFNTGEKSGGIGYHGNNFRFPDFYLFPVPRGMVAFKHNDQLSSFKAFVNSYIFYNDFNFKGRAIGYITIGYRQKRRLPEGFNDTMSSYWAF